MSKLIAVCGSPCSGKTTIAVKLAEEISRNEDKSDVVCILPDLVTPSLGYLFPRGKDGDMYSLGKIFDRTDICREDVMRQFNTDKDRKNLAILGYKFSENKYSYPEITQNKAEQFFNILRSIADYVVVDCSCLADDVISRLAKRDCDIAVKIYNPDIRCPVYYSSCINGYLAIEDKKIKVLNVKDNDGYYPIDEISAFMGGTDILLPYSAEIRAKELKGDLTAKLSDGKFSKAVAELAKKVLYDKVP